MAGRLRGQGVCYMQYILFDIPMTRALSIEARVLDAAGMTRKVY